MPMSCRGRAGRKARSMCLPLCIFIALKGSVWLGPEHGRLQDKSWRSSGCSGCRAELAGAPSWPWLLPHGD
jgi:hypothetical protein